MDDFVDIDEDLEKLYSISIYHDRDDFVLRVRHRRLTFGISMYAKKKIKLKSKLRLIYNAFFSMLSSTRYWAYVELYCQRLERKAKRINREKRVENRK